MMARKTKTTDSSARELLGRDLLNAMVKDFSANGQDAIKRLREENPAKYAEIASRLISQVDSLDKPDLSKAENMKDLGRKLLQSVGIKQPTDPQIQDAIAANDQFIATLRAIKDAEERLGATLN